MRAAAFCALAIAIAMGACGGRVEDGFTSAAGGARVPRDPGSPPPGGGRGPSRASLTELAAEVARAYCDSFDACCTRSGQAPIDRARCESVIAASIVDEAGRDARRGTGDEIGACADAVAARQARCPNEDAPWPRYGGATPPIFLATPVYQACAALVGVDPSKAAPACAGGGATCPAGATCVIDTCVAVGGEGAPCTGATGCVDSTVCAPSLTCEPPARGKNGQACMTDGCEAGLVCASGICAPAREHADLRYVEHDSPYSVRPDACRRFDYL